MEVRVFSTAPDSEKSFKTKHSLRICRQKGGFPGAIAHFDSAIAVTRTVSHTYDVAGRQSGITGPGRQSYTYTFDPLSRPDQTFGYDAAGRMNATAIGTSPASYAAAWSFTHNSAGQVTSEARDNDEYAFADHVDTNIDYISNGLNQYTHVAGTSFAYDANGNLTLDIQTKYDPATNSTTTDTDTYAYDTENRLVTLQWSKAVLNHANNETTTTTGTVTLRYDPAGRMYEVHETRPSPANYSTTRRLFYDGQDLVAEYDGSGTLLRHYVHGQGGGDDPLVWYEGAALRTLYTDARGSVVLIRDSGGNTVGINAYDEYGVPDANNIGTFGYTGQTWVPELGLWYYKARMYSPTLGRFMQTDPIGYGDGMNIYAYVGGDPVNGVDPSGLCEGGDICVNGIRIPNAQVRGGGGGAGANTASGNPSFPGCESQTCRAALLDFLNNQAQSGEDYIFVHRDNTKVRPTRSSFPLSFIVVRPSRWPTLPLPWPFGPLILPRDTSDPPRRPPPPRRPNRNECVAQYEANVERCGDVYPYWMNRFDELNSRHYRACTSDAAEYLARCLRGRSDPEPFNPYKYRY